MRSNDLVFGLCNDVFTFSLFQQLMLNELNQSGLSLELGSYHHHAGSLHVLTSLEHFAALVILGTALATLAFFRKRPALLLGYLALAIYLGIQAWAHATQGGLLFGAEVSTAGGILALGTWRSVAIWMENRKAERFRKIA